MESSTKAFGGPRSLFLFCYQPSDKSDHIMIHATSLQNIVHASNSTDDASGATSVKGTADVSPFRRILPQFLACLAKNMLLFDLGLAVSFPTIVIPVLRGLQKDRNPGELLSFTDEQSSWYGSIAFLAQPIGSLLSGYLTEPIGRRRAMMLVNIPHIIAFGLLHYASSLTHVYMAAGLLGLGVGFMEAPVITYVGEISQPSVRGVLLAFANIVAQIGVFTVYLLGSVTLWRTAALVCLCFPLLTVVAIYFIPETPYWLISRKRPADAIRSLQWLRGWVPAQAVQTEYAQISQYIEQSKRCDTCATLAERFADDQQAPCVHHKGSAKWRELFKQNAYRPFVLTMLAFMTCQLNGLVAIRPNLVQVFCTFGVPLDANWASVGVGAMDIISNTFCVVAVKSLGKRKLFLMSIVGCSLCCFVLGLNAMIILPAGTSSFDARATSSCTAAENYLALVTFVTLAFVAGVGNGIPWMCLSEIFPFRVRGPATGITAACSYLFVFMTTKTYLSLETNLAMSGTFVFYGVLGCIGFVVHYMIFPETEGRTLEEIEEYFSDPKRRLTDRHIRRRQTARRDATAKGHHNMVEEYGETREL